MSLAILFSGGKDSTMSLYWALQNNYTIECLVTAIPSNPESFLFHTSTLELLDLQAKALSIDLVKVQIKNKKDKEEAKELENSLKKLQISGLVVGGVDSNYQARIFSKIAQNLNIDLIAPYWQKSHESLIREAIEAGFEIIFTSISAEGLTQEWLGKRLDLETLEELKKISEKYGLQIGGEGGEYCTSVLNGPIFRQRINLIETEKAWKGNHGTLLVKKAELINNY